MVAVPKLRRDEQVLPRNRAGLDCFAYRIAHCFFVAVALSAIEMSEAHFQRSAGGLFGFEQIWNQCAEPDDGNRPGSVIESNSRMTKRIRRGHARTPRGTDRSGV